jgi:hypothetical protein
MCALFLGIAPNAKGANPVPSVTRGFETIRQMLQPFRALDYVLCAVAFILVGIAAVPLMTAWIR